MGGRLSSGTFVGRAAELHRLDDMLAAVSDTGVSAVLIGGDAGIGKSRLIDEFCRRARTRGALVAVGYCTPAEGGGLPFGPVVGVVRDASRQLATADVARTLGVARRMLGLDGGPLSDVASGLSKTNLFEALLQGVAAISESVPVVLVFEDLHWSDSASVEVVDFLTRNLIDRPVLLVASYRTDEVARDKPLRRLVAELGRLGRVVELELGGLSRDETAHLITGMLGTRPDWTLIDAVQARSGGNPFFAEELTEARNTPSLPSTLRNVVMLRIDRLSAAARQVVAVVAAAAGVMDHRLVAACAGLAGPELEAAVAEAVSQHVLVAERPEGSLRFRHALLREVAHDSLLPGERERLHKELAVVLTSRPELANTAPGHGAYELADHWWEAREWGAAAEACRRAGEHAAGLFAMHEAHGYLERALAAMERAGIGDPPVDLLLRAADAAYMSSEPRRSVELAREAIRFAGADPRILARCYSMLARNAWAAGETNYAVDALRRGAAILSAGEPTTELAGILAEEARILMLMSHYDAAEVKSREALAVARATASRADESSVLITSGVCVAERGAVDDGLAAIRSGIAIAEEIGNADQLNRGFANLTHVLTEASRLDDVVGFVLGDRADPDEADTLRLSAAGDNCAEALVRMGRFAEADRLMGRTSDRGIGSCVFGPHGERALIALRTGRFDDAEWYIGQADAMSTGISTVQVQGSLRMMYAELHLERGDPAAAVAETERALAFAVGAEDAIRVAEMYAVGIRAVIEDYQQAGRRDRHADFEKAQQQVAHLVDEADELIARRQGRGHACFPRLRAFVAQCHAEATRIATPAPDAWRDAATSWDACGEPYPAMYCRWREAEALLARRGERQRAVNCVRDAWRTATAIGAPTLRDRLEQLATRARITLDAPRVEDGSTIGRDLGLTAREVEVLEQLAAGRTDREIAAQLFISRKTASVHVSNLLRKLDVANRVEAGKIGQRLSQPRPAPD